MNNEEKRNKIILDIFNNYKFLNVLKRVAEKNGWTAKSKVQEDLLQDIMLKMLEKPTSKIIEWYEDNEERPLRIAIGILKKSFLTNNKLEGYNKHSFGTYMAFTSNLGNKGGKKGNNYLGEDEGDEYYDTLSTVINEDVEDNSIHIINYLKNYISEEDEEFIDKILSGEKIKGQYSRAFKDNKDRIFEELRQIAKEKNYKFLL